MYTIEQPAKSALQNIPPQVQRDFGAYNLGASMSDQPVQPIQFPLVTRCGSAMPSSDLLGGGSEPTIQIQLNTLGGQIYLMPLSVPAARGLLSALVLWPPAIAVVDDGGERWLGVERRTSGRFAPSHRRWSELL